ncbi:MAG: aminoglycoside phosphotransferase family protein [bacterium]|nr:aminoglycoside phosphotransferase family protein [bacterium]
MRPVNSVPDAMGPLLGRGARAEIFEWGENEVLKLFPESTSPLGVEDEARWTRLVYEAGLPVPGVAGVVAVGGRPGIVYTRVRGQTMGELLLASPSRVSGYARRAAELHARMHSVAAPGLPSQRSVVERKISRAALPRRHREAALAVLDAMPEGQSLCHGDFHPGNIMLPDQGGLPDAVIIDWPDASRGNPVADVARTVLLGRHMHLHAPSCLVACGFSVLARLFLRTYLRRYAELQSLPLSQLRAWRLPLAAARLAEGVRSEEKHLAALVEREVRLSNPASGSSRPGTAVTRGAPRRHTR